MAKAILAARKHADWYNDLITRLWEYQSAYRCIEAQERQYVNEEDKASQAGWSVALAALEFANTGFEEKLASMSDSERLAFEVDFDADVMALWGIHSVYECIATKVEQKLMGDANAVSGALTLLNQKLKQCIVDLDVGVTA